MPSSAKSSEACRHKHVLSGTVSSSATCGCIKAPHGIAGPSDTYLFDSSSFYSVCTQNTVSLASILIRLRCLHTTGTASEKLAIGLLHYMPSTKLV